MKIKLTFSKTNEVYNPAHFQVFYRAGDLKSFEWFERFDREHKLAGPRFYERLKKWMS